MPAFDSERIEWLISECRISEAAASLETSRIEDLRIATLYAISGDDRALAGAADPELLACRSAESMTSYRERAGGTDPHHDLIAGVVLTWSADSHGAYAFLRRAHDRAVVRRQPYMAVAALERLSHHALLFGDVDVARTAIDVAVRTASIHGLQSWLLRCIGASARLALDAGDCALSTELVERAMAESPSAEALALFAPTGAQLALEARDDAALARWSGPKIVETAIHSAVAEASIAASVALMIAADAREGLPVALALRRALFRAHNATVAPELFSMAARLGDLDEARFASRALAAVPAPQRRYLRAHRLLARAHLLFRSSTHEGWADRASDAARAFNLMGLRRWTNEAMLLLVHSASGGGRTASHARTSSTALTDREQQVADLIRRGARNREVASALQISEHTVERHVSSILGRLGLRSRWQIDTRSPRQR